MNGEHAIQALKQQSLGVSIALAALFVALGGPAAANDALTKAQKLVTSKQIKDGTIAERDLSPAAVAALRGEQGPAGPPGPQGPSGTADSPAQIVAKLLGVDGNASGLDADLVDGLSSASFAPVASAVLDGDSAGGDLAGSTYPSPQIAANAVGTAEIATNGVDADEIDTNSVGASEITTDAVGSSELAPDSVNTAEIANNAVVGNQLSSGGIFSFPSLNLGSVAANSCQGFEIATGASVGVDAGEMPLLSVGAGLSDGLLITGLGASRDDFLGVLVCNSTAGAINPPAFALGVRLIAPS